MSRRSSIFSSETLEGLPRPGRAVWLALALLLAARLGIGLANVAAFFDPTSPDEVIYLASELDYRLDGPASPSVLVMGSSRLLDVSSECVADALSLPHDEVSNYSQLSPSFWRTAAMLRRNPALAARAQSVLIDVLPFQLSSEYVVDDVLFARLATLRERFRVRDRKRRAEVVADWFVPAWSQRLTTESWLEAFRMLRRSPEERRDRAVAAARQRKDYIWALSRTKSRVAELEVVRSFILPGEGLSRFNAAALDDILSHLPADARLHLAWLPTSGEVAKLIRTDAEFARQRDALRAYLESHPDPRIRVHWFDDQASLGLDGLDYIRDGVHHSKRGLAKMCPVVARLVASDIEAP